MQSDSSEEVKFWFFISTVTVLFVHLGRPAAGGDMWHPGGCRPNCAPETSNNSQLLGTYPQSTCV